MKIGILFIIKDHIRTLYDARTHKISRFDIFLFFIVPILSGLLIYYLLKEFKVSAKIDIHNTTITFFGIFIAMLLNIQIGTISIAKQDKEKNKLKPDNEANLKNKILEELNSNIMYLILLCIIIVSVSYICLVSSHNSYFINSLIISLSMHFFLTLLMAMKRSYILIQKNLHDYS